MSELSLDFEPMPFFTLVGARALGLKQRHLTQPYLCMQTWNANVVTVQAASRGGEFHVQFSLTALPVSKIM